MDNEQLTMDDVVPDRQYNLFPSAFSLLPFPFCLFLSAFSLYPIPFTLYPFSFSRPPLS